MTNYPTQSLYTQPFRLRALVSSFQALNIYDVHCPSTLSLQNPAAVRDTSQSFLITASCFSALSLCELGSDFNVDWVDSRVTGGARTGMGNMGGYADDVGYRVRRDVYQRLLLKMVVWEGCGK